MMLIHQQSELEFEMSISEKEKYENELNTFCRACSDPVYIQDYFLSDGHSEKTTNATATFIKFGGHYYACTCWHVVERMAGEGIQTDNDRMSLGLMVGKAIINLSSFHAEGLQTAFKKPNGVLANDKIDIGLANIDSCWDLLERDKGKVAIDLDHWEMPLWDDLEMCAAAGYPTEHKERSGEIVESPMTLTIAELGSTIDAIVQQFTLSSKLEEPHGFYFSGTSGGPIIGCWDKEFQAIGLIFEGSPSSQKQQEDGFSLAGSTDILIRGLLLTPDRFAEWLDSAKVAGPAA